MNWTPSFNSSDIDTGGNYSLLPSGDYIVKITDHSYGKTRVAQFDKIEIAFSPEKHPAKKIFLTLTVGHDQEQTRKIAEEQISKIFHACGMEIKSGQAPESLIGKTLLVKVGASPPRGEYAARNTVSKFRALDLLGLAANPKPKLKHDKLDDEIPF